MKIVMKQYAASTDHNLHSSDAKRGFSWNRGTPVWTAIPSTNTKCSWFALMSFLFKIKGRTEMTTCQYREHKPTFTHSDEGGEATKNFIKKKNNNNNRSALKHFSIPQVRLHRGLKISPRKEK